MFAGAPEAIDRNYLFRLDYSAQNRLHQVLILSRVQPDFSVLPADYQLGIERPKLFAPKLSPGQLVAFKLLANPTRREKRDDRKNKPRRPILDTQAQGDWLRRKLEQAGVEVIEFRSQVQATVVARKRGAKMTREEAQTFVPVMFEGLVRVVRPSEFKQAIAQGIGSAKGYGFGLLSLARA